MQTKLETEYEVKFRLLREEQQPMIAIYYFLLVIALFAVLVLVLRITFFLVKEAEVVEIDLSEVEES